MIYNILLLLATNILIPLIPFPPQLFLSYCGHQYFNHQLTVYDNMNLTRHFHEEQFKKSFRDSLKRLHPDRGGSQEDFARLKGVKQIMQQRPNYYDLYNVTATDLKYHDSVAQVASMKQLLYEFQAAIFYFIAFLYFIAFTIDEKLRPSRKILLPLTIVFAAYEYYIHAYPGTETVFDMINGKLPIFMQSLLMKRIFCVVTAVIRTIIIRRKDQQMKLLEEIQKLPNISEYQAAESPSSQKQSHQSNQENEQKKKLYLSKLQKLLGVYVQKIKRIKESENSFTTKIKNWISKLFTFLIFGLMLWGVISSNMKSQNSSIADNQF